VRAEFYLPSHRRVSAARGFAERFRRVMPSPNGTMVLFGEGATTSRNREDPKHDEEKTGCGNSKCPDSRSQGFPLALNGVMLSVQSATARLG
jgi:hypothetical protein